ncbi:MAG TPA: RNA polymerase sigma factor [Candidatus Paceibacterota bacterium]|nr:RNA polymerase sigma factor [Candidatus Paceibacterota bacterium]HOK97228.1 RNA polymerase sigma factor [Candidatus Paceibacterota bacterium]HPP64581.1 RNA polymerase sigma factor [Candidatus Paceibacterota bacterium]
MRVNNNFPKKETISDEQIATSVQKGNLEDFGELVLRYGKKIQNYLFRFIQTKEEVEDLTQDIFLKAYSNILSFNPKKKFTPWLYQIAHNELVNYLRKKHYLSTKFINLDFDVLAAKSISENDILKDLENNLKFELIDKKLNKLNFKYRQPFVLFFYENLSYQEISDILKIPISTVGTRIKRAKEIIKKSVNNSESFN